MCCQIIFGRISSDAFIEFLGLSFFSLFSFKNESSGIAASIDAMAAGEDEAELSRSGSKNEADESPSVR